MAAGPTPDRSIVRQVRAIDPTLSVQWVSPPDLFAIYHSLQCENVEQQADLMARELQAEAALRGHHLALPVCQYSAWEALRDANLVCYVCEDDGSYRPLDGRIVEKLQRMDFYRRNLGLKDWRQMLAAKTDVLRERRLKDENDVWDCLRRDPVFARVASDILWGQKPVRSIHLRPENEVSDAGSQRPLEADGGAHAGAPPADPGAGGDPVPAEDGGAAPG